VPNLVTHELGMEWEPGRPHILVIACSDGRLQEATDVFLSRALDVRHYDRLYVPGGAGGLAASGREFLRARELRRECLFLVEAHQVEHVVLLFHGPAIDGPEESLCADYRRKFSLARAEDIRAQQKADVAELLERRAEYAGGARVSIFRFEVTAARSLSVGILHEEGSPSQRSHLDTAD
jgi:hypothetical protein